MNFNLLYLEALRCNKDYHFLDFIEPALGLGYPTDDLKALKKIEKHVLAGDMEKAHFEYDFIGIQNYTREIVKHSYFVPYLKAKLIPATKRKVNTTLMDWEVYPKGIYEMIKKFNGYPGIKKILITENGAAFEDTLKEDQIDDWERISYFHRYLEMVLKVKKEGLKVNGYFI